MQQQVGQGTEVNIHQKPVQIAIVNCLKGAL